MANDRDCENCKHRKKEVCKDGIFYHSCESWDCKFEPCEPVRNPDQLDCVSKQAVAEVLLKYAHDPVGKRFAEFLVSQINTLPSVSSSENPNINEVLDMIRAEIEGLTYYWCEVNPKSVIDDVLRIIDKYAEEGKA